MSVRSFNDECSDVLEKSVSVKSGSAESLSCAEEVEELCLARELLDKLTPAALSQLRRSFRKTRDAARLQDIDRRVEEVMRQAAAEEGIEFAECRAPPSRALSLDRQGFLHALHKIFGHHRYTPHAQALLQQLDPFGGGRVWWRQLLERLAAGAERPRRRVSPQNRGVHKLQHCKRETIVKLVSLETPDSFCYAAVSRGGRVGIYDGHLKILHTYEVFYDRSGIRRRVKNCWITDAVYLNDVQSLLFAASDRSLSIYDASTLTHAPVFCVTGLPHIPTCLAYSPGANASELAIGTTRGDITRLRFLQPRVSLLHAATSDQINCYFWMELTSPPHTSYCSVSTWRRAHSRAVRRVAYAGDLLLSCSHDGGASVRARHVPGKFDDYVFKVQRGVSCFQIVPPLHLLATGSVDGVVRLWDVTQPTPFACLLAPAAAAVLDVVVVADAELVVGYCNNCWLNIWDLNEECLLKTIKIQFPFLGVLGKKVEFGTYCIHPGPALQQEDLEDIPPSSSRRSSSVARGGSGGLQLLDLEPERKEPESEYSLSRPQLLVTSCDSLCVVSLGPSPSPPRAPPGDSLRARRPASWDLPQQIPSKTPTPRRRGSSRRPSSPPVVMTTKPIVEDLDTLLENAGLQGILEKDFVLMSGLKHDLNRKLAEMEANREAMVSAVRAGAPYLALPTHAPSAVPPVDEMTDQFARVMRLFPASSTVGTPAGSTASSPRSRRRRSSASSSNT